MLKITSPLFRAVALTALVGSFAFAAPVHAQDSAEPAQNSPMGQAPSDQPAADQAAPAENQPVASKGHMDHKGEHGMMNVEQRIKTLHAKLKITSDQETDWNTVAQTMRDNETNIDQLIKARHANAASMTAIDDLQTYQQIAQAHADGLQKMASSFKTLYGDMSDDQKKNADTVFGSFEGRHHDHKHGKKHHA
jgi:hypothetical protein